MKCVICHGDDVTLKVALVASQTFTMTPDGGYKVRAVTVDGQPAGAVDGNKTDAFEAAFNRQLAMASLFGSGIPGGDPKAVSWFEKNSRGRKGLDGRHVELEKSMAPEKLAFARRLVGMLESKA